MAEWLKLKIHCFNQNTNDVKFCEEILLEIKIKLTSLTPEEAKNAVKDVDLTLLFDEITSSDR